MANSSSYCEIPARRRIVNMKVYEPRSEGVTMTEEEKRSSRPERPDGYYELRRIVAANIRDHRQRRGWSLNRVAAGLAPYLGQMGASTISSWENSRTDGAKGFTIEEIFALCRVFEITIAELLAAPRILDIGDPIERIAGEEPPIDIAKVFVGTGRDDLRNSWRRYSFDGSIEYGPDEAPF
jgi:transcriptional regulator with XRE-family HTH domain